ncbi:cystathionine gamma-synthase (O-succinylhomoserine (thiol)-lyase) [Viridothelium virens]|uniref:Cystathionine gamma-synthase (O-succinylhomoserine (Thiol)-lyase) n=1 Tax=Viridothelium virens TaxID=1048519 RepID=A0A6A6HEA0_VIRVR|nr:cystathionine gamma-synthase (O-succinylhomoserine (thiol)-lyase) [Viridothelium virens]
MPSSYHPATLAIHADDKLNDSTDVAPALHLSTTFRYTNDLTHLNPVPDEDVFESADLSKQPPHVYSRLTAPNTTRFEQILSKLLKGDVVTYSSGLSAFHAELTFLNPKVVAIGHGERGGYHGCHGVLNLFQRVSKCKVVDLFADDATWDAAGLGSGDVVHMETPLNPTGIAYNISEFANRAHKHGAYLSVDATFGPPPLQDPFAHGADIVMHSGTKYFGGHSDMLCGVLAINPERERERKAQGQEIWWRGLSTDRLFLGSVMGSLEGWLGVRSLRTLELRAQRQSENATELVSWLDARMKEPGVVADTETAADEGEVVRKTVGKVMHASLQKDGGDWLKQQMPNGFGPVFSVMMQTREMARRLPSKLHLFHHATSLGGVESLIEWRKMSDKEVDDRLVRISVGVEKVEDLKMDLLEAFKSLVAEL